MIGAASLVKGGDAKRRRDLTTAAIPPSSPLCKGGPKVAFTLAEGASRGAISDSNHKAAFTLAEVLITLGIIGVVAAMTLPSLMQRQNERATVSQLKKVASALNQAYMMTVQESGTPDEWGMGGMYEAHSHHIMASKFAKYLKLANNCIDDEDNRKCKLVYSSFDRKEISRAVVLIDGTYVNFRIWDGGCNVSHSGEANTCGAILVDLNGNRKPNKNGEDIFQFYLTKRGVVPFGLSGSILTFEKACNKTIAQPYPIFSGENMYACAGWVIYNENMDYLHCNGLSWDGAKSCKELVK